MAKIRSIRTGILGAVAAVCLSLPNNAAAQILLEPNLRAFPASNLSVVDNVLTGNPELRFAVTNWNSGLGPLDGEPADPATCTRDPSARRAHAALDAANCGGGEPAEQRGKADVR